MDYGGSRRSVGIVVSSIRSIGGARLRRRRKSTGRIVITVVIGDNTWELNLSDTSSIMRIMRRRGEKSSFNISKDKETSEDNEAVEQRITNKVF